MRAFMPIPQEEFCRHFVRLDARRTHATVEAYSDPRWTPAPLTIRGASTTPSPNPQ